MSSLSWSLGGSEGLQPENENVRYQTFHLVFVLFSQKKQPVSWFPSAESAGLPETTEVCFPLQALSDQQSLLQLHFTVSDFLVISDFTAKNIAKVFFNLQKQNY